MQHRWPLAALVFALPLMIAPAALGAGENLPRSAGWHGREIREPLPAAAAHGPPTAFPGGWSAGSVGPGSGFTHRNGSERVREVQQRLRRRGYRPGPVDGRFGERTRAAVMWFQTKHGLPRSGRVDARSLATLRAPNALQPSRSTAQDTSPAPPAESAATPAFRGRTTASNDSDWPWLLLLSLTLSLGLAVIAVWLRDELHRRPGRAPENHQQPSAWDERPTQLEAPAAAQEPEPPAAVIGYVATERGEQRHRALRERAQEISSWCERRGWQLLKVAHDLESPSQRIAERPGLAFALDQITARRSKGLIVARLADITGSASELAKLLRWLDEADGFLIALDYRLDTTSPEGNITSRILVELGARQRDRLGERTRPGLSAIKGGAKRAAVRDDPDLRARIADMRASGMTLQAISDTLNAEHVPTVRGGSHWRPSSVQAATGYKRPPYRDNDRNETSNQ